jgi:hypothetical protein
MLRCNKISKKVNMRKSLLMTAMVLIAGAGSASADLSSLNAKDLRKAISGKTIHIQTPIGAEIPIRYRANGTMNGVLRTNLAVLAGESVNTDTGRWWVKDGQLCQKWNNWSKGRAYCYTLRSSGTQVHWSRSDGDSGTARLTN